MPRLWSFIIIFLFSCVSIAFKFVRLQIQQSINVIRNQKYLLSLPKEQVFESNDIELLRIIGNVNIIMESANADSDSFDTSERSKKEITLSIRLFEAKLWDNTRIFLKEFSPDGMSFGKKERSVVRKLSNKYMNYEASYLASSSTKSKNQINTIDDLLEQSYTTYGDDDDDSSDDEHDNDGIISNIISNSNSNSNSNTNNDRSVSTESVLPGLRPPFFPTLLGSLITDKNIENIDFQVNWRKRFPVSRPPASGNFWLIYLWTESSFKQLRRFPPLPQIIEGFDYFSKPNRLQKRFKFIRKIMRRCLESLESLHKSGYCHNTLTSECIWLTTTNQQEICNLHIILTELGSCEKFSNLGVYAKSASTKDLYSLGLIFLELIVSSFCDDNIGAQKARAVLGMYARIYEYLYDMFMYVYICIFIAWYVHLYL